MLALYPPAQQPVCQRFVNTTSILAKAGVPVPRVLATRCSEGLMLLEDAGDRTLYESGLDWQQLAPIYRRAASLVPRIQALSVDVVGALNPALDPSLLHWELAKTWELFLLPQGLAGDEATARGLRQGLEALCAALGAELLVPCHRDYMPRNLMLRQGDTEQLPGARPSGPAARSPRL